jgi:hypothetical protein
MIEAEITRMKDGRTALGYKAERAVDMDTGAIVAVTTHGGAVGDTASVGETLPAAGEAVAEQIAETTVDGQFKVNAKGVEEWVGDKGYHSGQVLVQARILFVPHGLNSRLRSLIYRTGRRIVSKLSGRMCGAMPSPVSQLSEARPGDTSPQPKRFGMRTVLPSGRREPSRRQCTNRGNQFVCYSGRKTQASASGTIARIVAPYCR